MLKKFILAALVATSAVFAESQIHAGGHAAFSFGSAWGENSDKLYLNWGPGFNAGADAKFDINPSFSLIAGIGVDYRRISSEMGQKYMSNNVDLTYVSWNINIPVLVRFNVNPQFFVDAGVSVGFNLSSDLIFSEDGYSETVKVPSEYQKTADVGLVAGVGYAVLPNLDVNLRFALGLTNMFDVKKLVTDEFGPDEDDFFYDDEEEFDIPNEIGFKNMRFQVGVTYWFF